MVICKNCGNKFKIPKYTIKTNYGYANAHCYYKIIKMEEQIQLESILFDRYEWQEIN